MEDHLKLIAYTCIASQANRCAIIIGSCALIRTLQQIAYLSSCHPIHWTCPTHSCWSPTVWPWDHWWSWSLCWRCIAAHLHPHWMRRNHVVAAPSKASTPLQVLSSAKVKWGKIFPRNILGRIPILLTPFSAACSVEGGGDTGGAELQGHLAQAHHSSLTKRPYSWEHKKEKSEWGA